MLAKKLTFFFWGVAISSIWWSVATLDFEGLFKFILAVFGTAFTVVGFAVTFGMHWDDK